MGSRRPTLLDPSHLHTLSDAIWADVSGVPLRQGTREQTRLVLVCGLPASGKTTLARELAEAYRAVRLNPDEWELALGVDPFDEGFQVRLEAAFWELTQRLLVLGTSVVLEWGFWARSERDEKREAARRLGVAVELRFLDAPYEELVRRVEARHGAGGIAITESHMERYRANFQPPTDEELSLYDPALQEAPPDATRRRHVTFLDAD
jgi:predicted kinase